MKARFLCHLPPYTPCSGGIRAMHYLPYVIRQAGGQVAVNQPCFYDPTIPIVATIEPEDIGVYPDVVPSNAFGTPVAMRWMMYFASAYYKSHGGDRIPKEELTLVYMSTYREDVQCHCDYAIQDEDIFELPNIECGDWLYPEKKDIAGLLFTGKRHCSEFPEAEYLPMPDPSQHPNHYNLRQATVAILRRTRRLYTMDHHTVLEQEAQLCGCEVYRVHGKNDLRRQEWADPEQRLMRPREDGGRYGQHFLSRALQFFNREN